ncbi:NIL domain-containing protein [Maribellus sediminis]|uniref:NIL domain-containing protein n=1 Tax=Maribellus sediminis TaxID=2696285 RepID=UPI0014319783|nr:NIL domain-containing protein [Maribellus sediminis]
MIKKRYILNFPPDSGDKAFTYHLVKDYDIRINILKAEVFPGKSGSLLLELQGKKENIEKGVEYIQSHKIVCESLDKRIHFQSEKCIDCGNCTAVCFAGALTMDKQSWNLNFNKEKCVVCELCIPACPLKLFRIDFQ